jgi:hypothetical protein
MAKKYIQFTPEAREELRELCNTAERDGKHWLEFNGYTLLTEYAKYLLEYLDIVLPDCGVNIPTPAAHDVVMPPPPPDDSSAANEEDDRGVYIYPSAIVCPCCADTGITEDHKDDRARWYLCDNCSAHFTVSGYWYPDDETAMPVPRHTP